MPETSAAPSTFSIDLPAAGDVPIREGEERHQAGLNLEDVRRRDATIQELRATLDRLEGTPVSKAKDTKSSSKRHRALVEKWQEIKGLTSFDGSRWNGPCAPATVINFNPLELKLMGELQRWTMPKAGEGNPVKLSFNGRTFKASYMTIKDPHVWAVITGAQDGTLGIDISIEARYIPPIGLAHQFYDHYVSGATDAQGMGGVLIFEGDIHTLDPGRLVKNDGCVFVPQAEMLTDGSGRMTYTVAKKSFEKCLEECLTIQRGYCQQQIADGHSFANSTATDIKNQLSNYHIMWHNWAMAMGYKRTAEKWASERLDDSPNIEAIFCPDCHQRQEGPAQYFCINCNAPFDAVKAFLAGKVVSPDRLAAYDIDSPEFKSILAETKRRKANIAMLDLGDEKPKRSKEKDNN